MALEAKRIQVEHAKVLSGRHVKDIFSGKGPLSMELTRAIALVAKSNVFSPTVLAAGYKLNIQTVKNPSEAGVFAIRDSEGSPSALANIPPLKNNEESLANAANILETAAQVSIHLAKKELPASFEPVKLTWESPIEDFFSEAKKSAFNIFYFYPFYKAQGKEEEFILIARRLQGHYSDGLGRKEIQKKMQGDFLSLHFQEDGNGVMGFNHASDVLNFGYELSSIPNKDPLKHNSDYDVVIGGVQINAKSLPSRLQKFIFPCRDKAIEAYLSLKTGITPKALHNTFPQFMPNTDSLIGGIRDLMIALRTFDMSLLGKLDKFFLQGGPKPLPAAYLKQQAKKNGLDPEKALYVYQHRDSRKDINRSYFKEGELAAISRFLADIDAV